MHESSAIHTITITDSEYEKFQKLIYDTTGIAMKAHKKSLVESRLNQRLRACKVTSFSAYYYTVQTDAKEMQAMIDHVTTNETSFFRESRHFEYIQKRILPHVKQPIRVWSAAASIGVEAYTLAMILDEALSTRHIAFEILASDISLDVLTKARKALYPLSLAQKIPPEYLKRYCAKGINTQEGMFIVKDAIKEHVRFKQLNLTRLNRADIGMFDMIFLRNVLIYFDIKTKREVVNAVIAYLKPGGYFFIGHSESLFDINDSLAQVMPTVYRKG